MVLNTEDNHTVENFIHEMIPTFRSYLNTFKFNKLNDIQKISVYNVYGNMINRVIEETQEYDITNIAKKPIYLSRTKSDIEDVYGIVSVPNNTSNTYYKISIETDEKNINSKPIKILELVEIPEDEFNKILSIKKTNTVTDSEWRVVLHSLDTLYRKLDSKTFNNGIIVTEYSHALKSKEENLLNGLVIGYIVDNDTNDIYTNTEEYRNSILEYSTLLNTLEEAIDLESDIDTDISNVESIMSNNEDITESMIIDLKDKLDNYNNILNLEFNNINLEGFDKLYSKETYRELYNNLKSAKYNITKLSYIVSERVKAYSLSFRNMLDRTFKTDINSALELKSKLEENTVDSIDATRFTKKYSKYSGDSNFYYDGTNPLIEDLSNNILNYLTNIRTRDFNSTSGYRSIDYKLKSDNDFDNSTLIGVTVTKNLIKGIYVLTGDEYVNIVVRKSHTIKDYSGKFIFTRKMALKLLNSLIEYRKEYFKFRDKQDSLIKDVARLKNLPEGIDYVKFYSTYTKNHNILLKALYSQFKEFNRFALLYASYYIKASNQMDIKGEDDEY